MSKQQIVEKEKDKREGKGRDLALSRRVYRIQNSDTFYVESERCDNVYYFVKYKPSVLEWWCSCMDNSTRGMKCKHIWSIEFAIRIGTLKDTDGGLATEAKVRKVAAPATTKSSYKDDDYSF